jgi:hypothetical protein
MQLGSLIAFVYPEGQIRIFYRGSLVMTAWSWTPLVEGPIFDLEPLKSEPLHVRCIGQKLIWLEED